MEKVIFPSIKLDFHTESNVNSATYLIKYGLFLIFVTETISRTDEGQPRPKYIFNNCGTNTSFFTLQRFGPSPLPNFK